MPEIDLVKDSTMQKISGGIDVANTLLAAVASQSGGIAFSSWEDVQRLVRLGLAGKVFAVGDSFTAQKNGENITWDVIGVDADTPADPSLTHSLTLMLRAPLAPMQFNAPQAIYAAAEGLPAGSYHFTPDETCYTFTLASAIPAGGQLTFDRTALTVSVYASPLSATAAETVAVAAGDEGTALTGLNNSQRSRYGSGCWRDSAIRRWLDSGAAAGEVWTPAGVFDRPPEWAAGTPGFLAGMDADFTSVIGRVIKRTALTPADGEAYSDTSDRFFLLSRTEVSGGAENGVYEGSLYRCFSDGASRIRRCGGSAAIWWLRSPLSSTAHSERYINTAGVISGGGAYNAYAILPACCVV